MIGTRIGLGLSRDAMRGVALRRDGSVVWHASTPRGREEPIVDVFARLLRDLPVPIARGAHVIAVVGPIEGQLRPLPGLPRVRATAELGALVTENADRFFLRETGRIRVSTPRTLACGEVWAAAVSETIVAELASACQVAGLRFDGLTPIAAALIHLIALPHGADGEPQLVRATWVDDGVRLCVELRGREPVRLVRERVAAGEPRGFGSAHTLPIELPLEFADAYIATQVRASDAFIVSQYTDDHRAARRASIRTHAWSGLAAVLMVVAMLAPGTIATRQAERGRARLATLGTRELALRRAEAALARATLHLNLVAGFETSRRSITLILGELALALPESTAVTTLHIDSLGGNLSVVTPRAGLTLQAISSLPQLAHTQLTGSVTREVTSGIELEHATVRFAFPPAARAAPRIATVAAIVAMAAP